MVKVCVYSDNDLLEFLGSLNVAKHGMYLYISRYDYKVKDLRQKSTVPQRIGNKAGPKMDTRLSLGTGNRIDLWGELGMVCHGNLKTHIMGCIYGDGTERDDWKGWLLRVR